MRKLMVCLLAILIAGSVLGKELSDPYQILNRHIDAMGGLDKVKAQKTSHVEGNLVLVGTGLEGTFVQWSQSPIQSRQEVNLKVFSQVSGDNGDYAWVVDQNGKVQIQRDEQTLKQRQVKIKMADLDYLNRDSKTFTVSYLGIDTVAGKDCYEVKIANNIDKEVTSNYYDTTSFMLLKTVAESPEGTNTTWYSDYRDADGAPFAFHQETVSLPQGLKQIISFTNVEINVPVDSSLFEPPKKDVEDFHFANGKSAEDIPFQYIEDHIYLPVKIGGKSRLWVLDSGAGATVVDETYAKELGLKLEGKIKGQGAGNLVDVSFTTLPAFSLTGLEFAAQKVAAIDLRSLFDKWLGIEVDGILGYDFLSRLVTKVDYANEKLSFFDPDSFEYHGDGKVVSTPVSQQNMLSLPLTVDDVYGGRWSLDLGAGGMSFHYPYAKEHGLLDAKGVEWLGHGAGGSLSEKRMLTKKIDLAGFAVNDIEITVPEEAGKGAFGHSELTGNIGNTLLRHFVLYLDYKQGQMIVEKGADFAKDFPHDNSGLQFENIDGDSLRVILVAAGTPAADAGFKVDDVIAAVNSTGIRDLGGIIAVKKLLRQPPGTKLTFSIMRATESKILDMTLRDLFGE